MPWRKCAPRFCASRESWDGCAKAAIAAQESAKTSATATRRLRIFNFLVASVMIPQPAFRDFSPQGEKPIPPAESKQEAGHGRVGATLRCFQVLRRWKFRDRKSTRLNSSHLVISYAVFCLKKKNRRARPPRTTQRSFD